MAVDVQSTLGTIGTNVASGLGTVGMFALYITITLVVLGVVGLFLYFHYHKKSFRIRVHVLRPIGDTGKFHWDAGFRGKQAYNSRKKEVRFEIYQAKKLGLQYNNEAVNQEFFVRQVVAGKNITHVFFSPNKQGWLQPITIGLDAVKGMNATVTNADLSYYQTELELMDSLFGNKSFMEKYYLLILIVLMIIVCVIQWYSASQINNAATLNKDALKLLTDTALQITQINTGNVSQVVRLG